MVSSISSRLMTNRLVSGYGVRPRIRRVAGGGVVRNVASAGVRTLGNMLVNRIADLVKGSGSYKLTGAGKKRVGRPRKIGRPRKVAKPKRTIGGMRRKKC